MQKLPVMLARPARPSLCSLLLPVALLLAGAAPAGAQTVVTTNYGYTGGSQTYPVPAGVTSLTVTAIGAAGYSYSGYNPGKGASVQATVPVTPGEVLTVVVGGSQSGYNGGGARGASGGSGGGSTSLNRAGTSTGDYLTTRNALLVAAGGGGAGSNSVGGDGGAPTGSNGGGGSATKGYGATQSGPGAANSVGGAAGSNAAGGAGNQGGGGGGGYYGGSGGGYNIFNSSQTAGGGGGSSWVLAAGTAVTYSVLSATGDGSLAITATLPAPTLTAVAPSPGGLGQTIALTGTNLGSPTALTINGADALAGIVSNSGTSLVVRVPATATASGSVSVTTAGGTASLAFTVLAPPGNALAFDGANDYVAFGSTPAVNNLGPGSFTLEAWVYYDGGTGAESILRKDGDYNFYINGNKLHAEVWSGGTSSSTWQRIDGTATPLPANRWAHVAAVWNGSTMQLYVNGVAEASTTTTSTISASANLTLGKSQVYGNLLSGRLDEVRIYTTALTAANVQADMLSTTSAVPASLKFYLNFDQGTPATASTGTNTGLTTLYDLASAYAGTLTNFSLASGNTTSNWVESYALVVPAATAATARTATGFTANWTAPALGTVDNGYRLDVSASSTFASGITTYTVSSGASQAVTGLTAGTTYYYRVRADKASVTGQGAYSTTSTVCPLPVAAAQNASVTLDVSGNATLAATAVNNGSTANCGPAAAGSLSVSPSTFSCTDAVTVPATNAALSFTASSQYVAGTNANLPQGNSARTIEAWVYPTNAQNGSIFNYGTLVTNQRSGLLYIGGKAYYVGQNNDLQGTTTLTLNAWHHLAATYDGTTLRLYVDGVQDASLVIGTPFNTTAGTWLMGVGPGGEPLLGRVDEVRVWNVARTAAQIAAARSASLPGSTSGLVACYRLNENSGSTIADASASNSPGTLYNAPTWTTPGAPVTPGVPVTLTVTDAGNNTSTAPAVVTVSVPPAPTTTWNGASSTAWTDCANWSYGKVPDAATSVVIPTGQPRYPMLSTGGSYPVLDLTVNTGGNLTLSSGATLQVNGNLASGGTATLSGTVAFVGSAITQTLSVGAGFTTLTVNKASGTVQLAQNLTINAALTLTSGTLTTTGSYQVNLGNLATLTESDASYVVGKVVVNRTLAPGTAESFSGLGLTLTPAAGSTAPGATQVARVTGTVLTGVGTSQGIQRYFDIQPATNSGLSVQLDFSYFDHERNGIPAANARLFKSVTGPGGPWLGQGGSGSGNTVTKAGITDFSVWTLGNAANPLPVELVAFTAQMAGPSGVRLAWATASEVNSARFEVQRSRDGQSFGTVGEVAAGSSANARTYGYVDAGAPAGQLYYRLRQVDRDGTSSYSPVRSVVLPDPGGLVLYPNPAAGPATLTGAVPGAAVQVLDAVGRVVTTTTADATGMAALPGGLAPGLYVVRAGVATRHLAVE